MSQKQKQEHHLHGEAHKTLSKEEPLEEDTPSCHGDLGEAQKLAGSLDEVTAQVPEIVLDFLTHPVQEGGRRTELLQRQHTVGYVEDNLPELLLPHRISLNLLDIHGLHLDPRHPGLQHKRLKPSRCPRFVCDETNV